MAILHRTDRNPCDFEGGLYRRVQDILRAIAKWNERKGPRGLGAIVSPTRLMIGRNFGDRGPASCCYRSSQRRLCADSLLECQNALSSGGPCDQFRRRWRL